MAGPVTEHYARIRAEAQERLAQRGDLQKIRIQVGAATCEQAAGAVEVMEEFKRHIESSGRGDIVIRQTGCTGRCSCEPIVGVILPGQSPVKYQNVDRNLVHRIFTGHVLGGKVQEDLVLDRPAHTQREFYFCQARRCGAKLGFDARKAFADKLAAAGIGEDRATVVTANCFGLCREDQMGQSSHVLVLPDKVLYRLKNEADLDEIIASHVQGGKVVERLRITDRPIGQRFLELYGDVSFFNRQSRVALRNSGIIDPENIDEYVSANGFSSLAKVLDRNDRNGVIEEITASHLRGRGGAGYPTGLKWKQTAATPSDVRYIICNADEGDPGAFMDRSMLEGDPLSVVEGMIIGGFAIGAKRGFFYVRAEYPLAIKRIETALEQARALGFLGANILGSGFDFDLEIRLGAGAFVCGEETALIHSIEGERGQPRIRPPYPSQSGLWGKPTCINNVETFANVPVIFEYGSSWFRQIGTEKSGGTKVFALAGKIRHTGLVEVPMGTSLREIVFGIGGGVTAGKAIKAIQTGGPAGGCIPAAWLDTLVDFDSLAQAGSIMGSGGMIVIDEDDCMVDIAKYFLAFSQDESCGKCTPCREGTKRMLEIFDRITTGRGELSDLEKLERLAKLIRKSSLCGLGRAAPNPVLSTLRHFRDEYQEHIVNRRCPAGKCKGMKTQN